MRLCVVGDGRSIHVQRFVEYLAGNHEVHLITHKPWESDSYETHYVGPFQPPKGIGIQSVSQLMRISANTKKTVRKIKPDLVHAHYLQDAALFAARSGFHPLVVSAWGSDVLIHPFRSRTYRIMTKYVLKKADAVHSVSGQLTSKLIELGTDSKKVFTLPYGVDTALFKPGEMQSGEIQNVVISTRNLKPVYNHQLMLRAAPQILKEIGNARFMIAGEGEQREELEVLARELNVADRVELLGSRKYDEIPSLLNSSKVYVSVSLSDGTSNSLMEAMACGIFPIVSDIEANAPWIKDGENGFLVPTDDPEVLAAKTVEAMRNEELRENARKINPGIVAERANWKKNMMEIEKLYDRLVKGVGARD
jgi:glycosyltransferase involved in cell wall biosynthesis